MRRRVLAALTALAMACGLVITTTATGTQATSSLPVSYSSISAIGAALLNPGGAPPGANDWDCTPSASHPRPVVLVHGTLANMTVNWNALSPLLKNNGYCVYALNYGGMIAGQIAGTGAIEDSAAELDAFVDQVLASTGAAEVDIVGHSQGGMMPRYYLRFLGGADEVGTLVGLAPSNHGTTLLGLAKIADLLPWLAQTLLGSWCESCLQQVNTSTFMQQLNAGGDTVPGVNYTVIQTRYDEVVTPYRSAFLSGPNVTNIRVQDSCWLDFSEHLSIAFDHIALTHVLNTLDPAHPQRPRCSFVAPVIGG